MEDYELKRKWKKAQFNNELLCEDCGNPVELKAGDINIPHFAHRKGALDRDCYYNCNKETEEHSKAKSILYSWFREKYPAASVETTKKQPNGRRTDIYIEFESYKLAIEYQRDGLRIPDWDARHEEYVKLGITDLWFLSSKIFDRSSNDNDFLTQVLLHETTGNTAIFFDVANISVILLRQIDYTDKYGLLRKKKFFNKRYNLSDITISLRGEILCNFDQLYANEKDKYIRECKALEEEEILEQKRKINTSVSTLKRNSFPEEHELTKEEQELEIQLSLMKNGSLEYRDHEAIKEWVKQFKSVNEASKKINNNVLYNRLLLDCDRTLIGYQNNGYIVFHNVERLKLKLKMLSDIVSGINY